MKSLIPATLILASMAIFVFFTNGAYQEIKALRQKIDGYDKALGKSLDILNQRKIIEEKYKSIDQNDLVKLQKMLPDHVDNVQLILDINGIAREKGMAIGKIKVVEEKNISKDTPLGPEARQYASILVSFRTIGSYENFMMFLKNVEQDLRIVDVVNVGFKATPQNLNEYLMTIKTYWLK